MHFQSSELRPRLLGVNTNEINASLRERQNFWGYQADEKGIYEGNSGLSGILGNFADPMDRENRGISEILT